MRHIIPISGKDSLATAIIQMAKCPDLYYEFIFNDTMADLPETKIWLAEVESRLNIRIEIIGENLVSIIDGYNYLPSSQSRYCTRMSKIEPMEKYLGDEPATIYFGIRYDERNRMGYTGKKTIIPVYPLIDARMTLPMVWTMLEKMEILPPSFFWKSMYDMVCNKFGSDSFKDYMKPWQLHHAFAWRSRPNCFFCFFQRQYEFIGLHEHYPDLFWEAVRIEEQNGSTGYYWQKGHTLRSLLDKSDLIKKRRAKDICKYIAKAKNLGFGFIGEMDALSGTSCGLFCGK